MTTKQKEHNTKRPHYIPQVYSQNFCSDNSSPPVGYLYEKSPVMKQPVQVPPINFGVRRFYYAYEKNDGTRDTQTAEKLFGVGEDDWPNLLEIFEKGIKPYPEHIDNICTFLATMRVRVPGFRKQLERCRAEKARDEGMVISRHGKGFNKEFADKVEKCLAAGDIEKAEELIKAKKDAEEGSFIVAVNPQTSLIRALKYIEVFLEEFMKLNWVVARTDFDQDFVTTDNPVVWYDLKTLKKGFIPYQGGLSAEGLEVIFPITKKLILVGNRVFEKKFSYATIPMKKTVKQLNQRLVIAADKFIYASQDNLFNFVARYKNVAPVLEFKREQLKDGYRTSFQPALGKPYDLPKWKD